jgi:predicted CXXCH cytochrome family protein
VLRKNWWTGSPVFSAVFFLLLSCSVASWGEALSSDVQYCLGCHGQESLEVVLPSGEKRSLYVDAMRFEVSVHGNKLACTNCHVDIKSYPHPQRAFKTLREFTLAYYESCKGCHFDNYTKSLDSVHYALLSKGDFRAPLCIDCHGAHYIAQPDVPKFRISETCSRCHSKIYDRYAQSVHGKALVEAGNTDVPTCTDCHRSHNIEDPRKASFHLKSPQLCARCHTDEKLMKKYGLSTSVMGTYLKDFHGVTASFYRNEKAAPAMFTAVCTDCHGVHDILSTRDPNSTVMKENLLRVCQKCHPTATANFPAAWLSHYEPSPKKASLVYYVKLFYRVFIPFVIIGLVLQILLHIWRLIVSR